MLWWLDRTGHISRKTAEYITISNDIVISEGNKEKLAEILEDLDRKCEEYGDHEYDNRWKLKLALNEEEAEQMCIRDSL